MRGRIDKQLCPFGHVFESHPRYSWVAGVVLLRFEAPGRHKVPCFVFIIIRSMQRLTNLYLRSLSLLPLAPPRRFVSLSLYFTFALGYLSTCLKGEDAHHSQVVRRLCGRA